ncbi:hypothetical protein [Wolinella succinogenes]|uniref:hypothetical protein n=1 Tax=Wolinella succinogenes TaxID=844 RepID=UPI00240A772E|nr:hypothetical protein [Wolinella succinogenes]
MFHIEGDTLNLSWEMTLDEVKELKEFLEEKLVYIEAIELDEEGDPSISSLLQLLFSVKKSKPEIVIPALEMGVMRFGRFGKIGWRV